MTIQGVNSASHANAIASTSTPEPAVANTARQQALQVSTSSHSIATPEQTRGSPLGGSHKATGAMRNRAGALAAKFERQEGSLLQLYAEQMELEGELLKTHGAMPYEDVLGNLHENLAAFHDTQSPEAARLLASGGQVRDAIEELSRQQGEPDAAALNSALATHAQALVEHLEVSHSRFDEALKDPGLSAEQKRNIEHSRTAFVDYAIRVGTEMPRMLQGCTDTTQQRLDQLGEQLSASKAGMDALPEGKERELASAAHGQLQKDTDDWKAIHDLISTVKNDYNPPAALADAIHNVRLPHILAEYDKQRSYVNILRSTAPAAVSQLIASSLHFGGTRSSIEQGLSNRNFATRVSASGTGLGVAHELVNNSIRPASQELMGSIGGMGVRPVKATEVIPNPTRSFTINGEKHTRTDEQMAAATLAVKELRATFTLAQNKHKFGTAEGEVAGYGSFGAAQAVLEGLVAAGVLPAKTIPALMITSAAGGFLMAGTQTFNQLTTTVKDQQGRILPTHVPKNVDGALLQRLAKVGKDGLSAVDLRETAVQEAFLSKIFGSIQGVTLSTAVADQVRHIGHDSPTHIASKLLVSALGPSLTLPSFFAAMQTKPEATKGGTGRFANGLANVANPDRDTLPHTTQPGSLVRDVGENSFHRVRGVLQLPSQGAVQIASAGVQLVGSTASAAGQAFRNALRGGPGAGEQQPDLELGNREAAQQPT